MSKLDTGVASNNRGFRIKVQGAFTRKHGIFDKIQFPDDYHLISMSPPINPGDNVQSHGWNKLCAMWKDIHSVYKEVLFNFTKSGLLIFVMEKWLHIT